MSPVGHSLVGLSFAVVAFPALPNRRRLLCVAPIFVALANLPDWPIPGWGHDRYDISHSIFVNCSLISILIAIATTIRSFSTRVQSAISIRCLLFAAAAWLSHLFLDSLYSHGQGVVIGWPFNEFRLRFPLPFFQTLDLSQSLFGQHNLSVFGIEFLAYSPILMLAMMWAPRLSGLEPVVQPEQRTLSERRRVPVILAVLVCHALILSGGFTNPDVFFSLYFSLLAFPSFFLAGFFGFGNSDAYLTCLIINSVLNAWLLGKVIHYFFYQHRPPPEATSNSNDQRPPIE